MKKQQSIETGTPVGVPPLATGSPLFDPRLLSRAIMSKEDAEQFKRESRMTIQRCADTDATVVCYIRPDGHILIDAVRIPTERILDNVLAVVAPEGCDDQEREMVRYAIQRCSRTLANAGDVARGGSQHSTQSKT